MYGHRRKYSIFVPIQPVRCSRGITLDAYGALYIADSSNHRIRKVTPDGIITTVAGIGIGAYSGDGGPATAAHLYNPHGVAVDAKGTLYIADTFNNSIRKITPNGVITTVAGIVAGYNWGFSGDGGPATAAKLNQPKAIAVDAQGTLYVGDAGNYRVRKITPDGIISTVAGTGVYANSGDGGPATSAAVTEVHGIAIDAHGALYLADHHSGRIRKITPDGIIRTVAGSGSAAGGFSGDGGPATAAKLSNPRGVAVDAEGTLYIVDGPNRRVRVVTPDGIITTVAGNGTTVYSGDGGPATAAGFGYPSSIAVDPQGALYVSDDSASRIRKISSYFPKLTTGNILISSEDGTQLYTFDSAGRHLSTLSSATGAELYHFTYNAGGTLIQITDGDGNVTIIERDASGQPTGIVAPDGQETVFTLDGNGYLATIANPAGETTQMTYTAGGLLTTFTNPRNKTSTITYNGAGRLIKDMNAAGGFWSLSRTDPSANAYQVSLTSALGRTTSYKIEALSTGDKLQTNTAPDGTVDAVLTKTDGSVQSTAADGTVGTTASGPDPRFGMQAPLTKSGTIQTPGGLTLAMTASRSATLSNPNNLLSLITQTDSVTINGKTGTAVFNAATKKVTSTSPAGRQQIIEIDGQGRPLKVNVAGLAPMTYGYDIRGRLTSFTQTSGPNTRMATLSYNAQGWLDTVTDPLGRSIGYQYDDAGRAIQQTLPDGSVIAWSYDENGNVTGITPPSQPTHTFNYTPIDLEEQYDPPLVSGVVIATTHYAYNLDKQLTTVTRPDGQTIAFAYDSGGRLSARTTASGSVTYGYAAGSGHVSSLTTSQGINLGYAYDGFLPTTESWTGPVTGSVARSYNNDFAVTGLSVNGASLPFAYDADGLLTKAGDLTFTRSAQNGLITASALGNTTTSRTYNGFGELTGVTALQGGNNLLDLQYTSDALGRLTQVTETVFANAPTTLVYSYDNAGRLAQVTQDGALQTVYAYDPNGNRTANTDSNNNVTVGSYDDQDRLLTYGATSYTYADNGELQTKTTGGQTTNYMYDLLSNLTAVTLPDGTAIEYLIDGRNRRTGKKVNGVVTQGFLYQDQLKPIAELDAGGNVVTRFVYGTKVNVPEYMIKGGATYRILTDHLGSPRLVVDTQIGSVAQELSYDAFGTITGDSNPGFQPFGFAGGLYDQDTQLTRFGARDYDASTGRWTTKDPIGLAGGLNTYAYIDGNPMVYTDPSGNCPWCAFGAAAGVWGNITGQLIRNGGDWGKLNAKDVALAGLAGAASGGLGALTGSLGLGGSLLANAGGSGLISGAQQAASNLIEGKCVDDNVFNSAGKGALFGLGGAAAGAAVGAGAKHLGRDSFMNTSNSVSGPFYPNTFSPNNWAPGGSRLGNLVSNTISNTNQ
jgi:RHS repeat-associated protein